MAGKSSGVSRPGRRPGDSGTREAILVAARHQFGERPYKQTTIRSVAEEAAVDPSLVMHFFGSKDELLVACVQWPFDPAAELPRVLDAERGEVGTRLVELFVRTWDTDDGRNPIVALLRASISEQAAERQLRAFYEHELLMPVLDALGSDHPELRTNLVVAQLVGAGVARYVLRLEPLASLDAGLVVALLAPSVQGLLTGRLPDAVS